MTPERSRRTLPRSASHLVGRTMAEQKGAAIDALSLWSIWSRSQINESGVKGRASKERGVRIKLSEEQHCIHLHPQEVPPAILRRIVVAQTILPQPEPPLARTSPKRGNRKVPPEMSRRTLPMVVLDGVRGDVSPRVDVHEAPFAEFCIHCVQCKPKK